MSALPSSSRSPFEVEGDGPESLDKTASLDLDDRVDEVPNEAVEDTDPLLLGWRRKPTSKSLGDAHGTVSVPDVTAAWYRQWAAFIGVGFMVSVG